jgi:hypothetical protein
MQPPQLPFTFPPKGYVSEYQVQSGERWIDIAERFGVGGWDLVEFNFGTRDEKVYNWCMKYELGCIHTTDDGMRYSFHQATIGKIYIPPVGWTPPGRSTGLSADEGALRGKVLKVLGSSSLKSIRFQNPTLNRTTPEMLMRVASLIVRNKVRIKLNPKAIANEYDPDDNVIILTDADTSQVLTRSTIVHEVVHAAQDAEGRTMLAVRTECDAYIAQMIYFANEGYVGPPTARRPVLATNDLFNEDKKREHEQKVRNARAEDRIFAVAWTIGQRVITTYLPPERRLPGLLPYPTNPLWENIAVIPEKDHDDLASAVLTHPLYKDSDLEVKTYDGI